MSCKEMYERLTRENQEEISLRFGTAYEGRAPSNPVVQEFEDYISKPDRLKELEIAWDNRCPEALLTSLLKGIKRNPNCHIETILFKEDVRPLTAIEPSDLCHLVHDIAKYSTHVSEFRFGHNTVRTNFWIDLYTPTRQSFGIDPIVFSNTEHLATTLRLLLHKLITEDPVKKIMLDLAYTDLPRDDLLVILGLDCD